VNGAIVQIAMSFEVWKHKHGPIEIYGDEGSLAVPDPNAFGGPLFLCRPDEDWQEVEIEHAYADGNYRSIGLADMAEAIRQDRPHRASGGLALHVLEVMEGMIRSAEGAGIIEIETRLERPAALSAGERIGE
jgi:predicted dehydrogenase